MSAIALFGVFAALTPLAASFPGYQDPFQTGPSVPRPPGPATKVSLFDNVALDYYWKVVRQRYNPPGDGPWAKVVLEFQGSVAGVQYDRAGCLWVNEIELLRVTTPEPDAAGIAWFAERDVTLFQSGLNATGEAVLQIPNLVNREYTGILHINASLVFYSFPTAAAKATYRRKVVLPLKSPAPTSNPWISMRYAGSRHLSASVALPVTNAHTAEVVLFQSNHADEEFWTACTPDWYAEKAGLPCGGGAYREIRLYVDGVLAGALPPFPVIYSGGVNPLLWRPQAGITSFNLPPMRFELSPFVGLLNDGQPHTFEVKVANNSAGGAWFLDPILVVEESADCEVVAGGIVRASSSEGVPAIHYEERDGRAFFRTLASTRFELEAVLNYSNGASEKLRLSGGVDTWNRNLVGAVLGVTRGELTSDVRLWRGGNMYRESVRYPYYIWNTLVDEHDSLEIDAVVKYAYERSSEVVDAVGRLEGHRVAVSMMSNATYNRTKGAERTTYIEDGTSVQNFTLTKLDAARVWPEPRAVLEHVCFAQAVAASNGFVTSMQTAEDGGGCDLAGFCAVNDLCSPPVGARRAVRPAAGLHELPMRHPRMRRQNKGEGAGFLTMLFAVFSTSWDAFQQLVTSILAR